MFEPDLAVQAWNPSKAVGRPQHKASLHYGEFKEQTGSEEAEPVWEERRWWMRRSVGGRRKGRMGRGGGDLGRGRGGEDKEWEGPTAANNLTAQ